MILHGGFTHLAMNMVTLGMLGFACEYQLGWFKYLILIIVGGVGGNVFSAIFQAKCGIAIGASTSIMALMAFSIVFFLVNY
jgi:rhomboid protease GluP